MKMQNAKCRVQNARKRLKAAADRTENVEQLEAIERDFEKLIGQAKAALSCRTPKPAAPGGKQ